MSRTVVDTSATQWRWVEPAPIEASFVLWALDQGRGRVPDLFTHHLILALYWAPTPTLLQLASVFPGLATATWHAKQGEFARLRIVAGDIGEVRRA